MTDAYIEGFCKTAEEHGIAPADLLKAAGIAPIYLARNLGRTVMKSSPRSLFGAGNIRKLKQIAATPASASGPARDLLTHALRAANRDRIHALDTADAFLRRAYPSGLPASFAAKIQELRGTLDSRASRLAKLMPQSTSGQPDIQEVKQMISRFFP